jgi:hypothetical protein
MLPTTRNLILARHLVPAASFDGTASYLTRDAGLTGAVDSKLVTGSLWVRTSLDGVGQRIVMAASVLAGATSRFSIAKTTANLLNITANSSTASAIIAVSSSANSMLAANGWMHIAFSFDSSDTAKRWIYINDVSNLTSIGQYNDGLIDFTTADFAVGAVANGTLKLQGDLADLALWPGVYLDLSVEANRRLFLSSLGRRVDLAASGGAISTLGTPILYLRGPGDNFRNNLGSGGSFTVHGSLGTTWF